jgi:hypothetical protein
VRIPYSYIGLAMNRGHVIHGLQTPLDPNPDAMPYNSGQYREQKTLYLCVNCNPLQPSATADRTLVMRLGQRFESARRLSRLVGICR